MNNLKTMLTLHFIHLAIEEEFTNDETLRNGFSKERLISKACEYGKSHKITEKDISQLLGRTFYEILEIKHIG